MHLELKLQATVHSKYSRKRSIWAHHHSHPIFAYFRSTFQMRDEGLLRRQSRCCTLIRNKILIWCLTQPRGLIYSSVRRTSSTSLIHMNKKWSFITRVCMAVHNEHWSVLHMLNCSKPHSNASHIYIKENAPKSPYIWSTMSLWKGDFMAIGVLQLHIKKGCTGMQNTHYIFCYCVWKWFFRMSPIFDLHIQLLFPWETEFYYS